MNTKRTILSEKESKLIENLLSTYGSIVKFSQIYEILKTEISKQAVLNLVNKLVKNGWLVTIKKGIYFIASIDSRQFVSLPVYKIAQVLEGNSYVSFEAALNYHGMFDQLVDTVTSVSSKRHKIVKLQGINYKFIFTKGDLFYGWEERRVENYMVRIASPEKAVLDFLAFGRNTYSVDLVLEKLKGHKDDFDYLRFYEFTQKQTLAVKRILGFLFDKAGIDSDHIHQQVKYKRTPSFMTSTSRVFSAKWRLYYDDRFAG
jgi:predicted transcriptional regulator of viral defense system